MSQNSIDPTAVYDHGWHCSKRMPYDMFVDCDLSPLSLAHSFTIIPSLLSEFAQHVKYHVKIRSLSNRRACSTQPVSTHDRGIFSRTRQPTARKKVFAVSSSRILLSSENKKRKLIFMFMFVNRQRLHIKSIKYWLPQVYGDLFYLLN